MIEDTHVIELDCNLVDTVVLFVHQTIISKRMSEVQSGLGWTSVGVKV